MSVYEHPRGDLEPPFEPVIKDRHGQPVDLSTAISVRLIFRRIGGDRYVALNRVAVKLDQTQQETMGHVRLAWEANDEPVLQRDVSYDVKAEIMWPGERPQTARGLVFRCVDDNE